VKKISPVSPRDPEFEEVTYFDRGEKARNALIQGPST